MAVHRILAMSAFSAVSMSLLVLAGCKAAPVESTSFLDNSKKMSRNPNIPVHRVWKEPTTSIADYDKIYVKPVFTKHMVENTALENLNVHTWLSNEKKNVAEYAKYVAEAFKKAIKKSKRFTLADAPGPKTMTLELSLVKLVPGKPILGAISNLGRLTPIGLMLSPLTMAFHGGTDGPTKSSVAIEGRIIDSQTNNLVAMFADRRKEKTAYFNARDFRPHGNPEQIADEWAADFVKVLETRPLETGKKVESAGSLNAVNF